MQFLHNNICTIKKSLKVNILILITSSSKTISIFEILANITGERLQFASKLLDISDRKNDYDIFINEY